MKNTILYLGTLLFAMTLFSCNNTAKEEKQEDQFIDFYNTMQRRSDQYNKFVQHLDVALGDMATYTKLYKEDPDAPELKASFSRRPQMVHRKKTNVPKFMKAEYEEMVHGYLEAFEPFVEIADLVREYESKKIWETSEAEAEYWRIVDLAEENMVIYEEKKKPLFEKLHKRADEVEGNMLEDHPLKPQITRGKKILALMDETMDVWNESEEEDLASVLSEYLPKIQEAYDDEPEFESGIPYAKKGNYKKFNESTERFLKSGETLRVNLEEGEDEETLQEPYRIFNQSYEDAYSAYNNFAQF